jgi:hypothetical protein
MLTTILQQKENGMCRCKIYPQGIPKLSSFKIKVLEPMAMKAKSVSALNQQVHNLICNETEAKGEFSKLALVNVGVIHN